MSVEDRRMNIYKWESCCFIDFKFSVSFKIKKKLKVDWIKECWRIIREKFQKSCVNKIKKNERVSKSNFNEIKEDERIAENKVNEIEECERIIYKKF